MLGENNKKSKSFEIKLVARDREGNPLGHYKTFSSDDPSKIAGFIDNKKARRRRKKKGGVKNLNNNGS